MDLKEFFKRASGEFVMSVRISAEAMHRRDFKHMNGVIDTLGLKWQRRNGGQPDLIVIAVPQSKGREYAEAIQEILQYARVDFTEV